MAEYVSHVKQFLKSIDIQPYDRYLPNAFNDSLTMLEKVNKVVQQMNESNQLTNDVIVKWNEFVDWVNTDGLNKPIDEKMDEYISDGTFKKLIDGKVMDDFKIEIQSLNEKQVTQLLSDAIIFIKKIEGSTDDTTIIQNAINNASLGGGVVKLQKDKIYIVGSLLPKQNVTIDLNGSTLKLKDNTQLPVFYDWATKKEIKHKNFNVINGTIDANMQNNNSVNQSAGVFWLMDWDGLLFDKLTIKNAFRNIFNLFSCHNIKIPNVLCVDNGLKNAGNFYSYGATFEPGCKNIEIGNFIVRNMYGFGIHFYDSENIIGNNITMENLTHPTAIAITFTKAKRVKINNITCKNVLGDSIEINASTDVMIDNMIIDTTGKRPIIFGDNGLGINNERITINQVKTTNTTGNESLSINYAKNVKIKSGDFDKSLTTTLGNSSQEVEIIDSVFNVPLNMTAIYYNRFNFLNTSFKDILIKKFDNNISHYSNVTKGVLVLNNENFKVKLVNLLRAKGSIIGKLMVTSSFVENANQSTFQELSVTSTKLSELTVINSDIPRRITVTLDTSTNELVFTNTTGVTLQVDWNLHLY